MGQGLSSTALDVLMARARRRARLRRVLGDLARPLFGAALLVSAFECAARVWPLPDLSLLWLALLGAAGAVSCVLFLRNPHEALVLRAAGELAGDTPLFESLGRTHGGAWDELVTDAARKRSESACREGAPAPLEHLLMPLAVVLAAILTLLPGRIEPSRTAPALIAEARAGLEAAARRADMQPFTAAHSGAPEEQGEGARDAVLRRELETLKRLAGTEDLLAAAVSMNALAAGITRDGMSREERAALEALLQRVLKTGATTPTEAAVMELRAAANSGNGREAARALGALARRLEDMAPFAKALRRLEFVADATRGGEGASASTGTGTAPVSPSRLDGRSEKTRSQAAEALLDRYFRGLR